jgi:hypothetical protein
VSDKKQKTEITWTEVEVAGQTYRVGISYPKPEGTLEEAAAIVLARYMPGIILSEKEDEG